MANPLDTFIHNNLIGGDFPILSKKTTVLLGEPADMSRGALMGLVKTAGVTESHVGNTGGGVMGAITKGILAKAGDYLLTLVRTVANGGDFILKDPEGNLVGMGQVGVAFVSAHLNFTLADGAPDFNVGDKFILTVAPGGGQSRRLDVTSTDGSALPDHIQSEDMDASLANKASVGYTTGVFNERAITMDAPATLDTLVGGRTLREHCRDLGIHFVRSMNTSGVA